MSESIVAFISALPASAFCDENLFAREVARFFRSEWCFALHRDHLSLAGRQIGLRVGGRELLVVVDGEGRIRALKNRCLHDGNAILESGRTTRSALLRCPHHGWCYSLEGRLMRGPGFDVSDTAGAASLPAVPVSIVGSCVMVAPDMGPADATPRSAPIVESLANRVLIESSSEELPANWKLVLLALCQRGWRYVFPNLAVAADGASMWLLRLEPLATEATLIVLERASDEPTAASSSSARMTDVGSVATRLHAAFAGTVGAMDVVILDELGDVLVGSLHDAKSYPLSDEL